VTHGPGEDPAWKAPLLAPEEVLPVLDGEAERFVKYVPFDGDGRPYREGDRALRIIVERLEKP